MSNAVQTFLELAAIDEVYPNEKQVLEHIANRLAGACVTYKQDTAGNIVAVVEGQDSEAIALCGHADIAA